MKKPLQKTGLMSNCKFSSGLLFIFFLVCFMSLGWKIIYTLCLLEPFIFILKFVNEPHFGDCLGVLFAYHLLLRCLQL